MVTVAKKPKAKPQTKKPANADDAAAVLARMKQKEAENPDGCPFC
jgi:hypothetical protein